MATWTVSSPILGDTVSDALDNIRGDFTVIAAAWNGDHQILTGDGLSSKKHKQVTLPESVSAPATAIGDGALYTKDDGTRPALFYRQEDNGTEIQLTSIDPVLSANGYTILPGPVIMQWGSVSVTSTQAVVFPIPFTTLYNIQTQLVRSGPGGSDAITNQSTSGFTIKISLGDTVTFYWMAVGV